MWMESLKKDLMGGINMELNNVEVIITFKDGEKETLKGNLNTETQEWTFQDEEGIEEFKIKAESIEAAAYELFKEFKNAVIVDVELEINGTPTKHRIQVISNL